MVATGNEGLVLDSGEGAWGTATTSKAAGAPIPGQTDFTRIYMYNIRVGPRGIDPAYGPKVDTSTKKEPAREL